MSQSSASSSPDSRRPSRRHSSGQRTPRRSSSRASPRYSQPPPSGPAISRSASRHRTPVGNHSARATPAPIATNVNAPGQRVQPGFGPSPGAPSQPYSPYTPAFQGQPPPVHPAAAASTLAVPPSHSQNALVHPRPQPGYGAGSPSTFQGAPQPPIPGARKKRLIVACDGTWKSADSANLQGDAIKPSNVVHITRAVKPVSRDGIAQVVFYQAGVGTEGGPVSRLIGGATAKGLEDDILQAYYWLCQNWVPGDDIFLLGFSRGAFTARSVGGLVNDIGLLTREGIKHVNVIFKDYENRNDPTYVSDNPDRPFRRKTSAADPKYVQQLEKYRMTRPSVSIKAIAVFDTVGSLGIPRVPVLERLGLQSRGMKQFEFYDTTLGRYVEHAFQALALDEQRAPFAPSLWEKPEGNKTDLRQVWFPGVHTNVGGGYADSNLSNISLAWMLAQLTPLLDLDGNYILEQADQNVEYYKAMDEKPRAWSLGRLYNSLTGVWVLGGRRPRKPGMYTRVSQTGVPLDIPLKQTNEYVHASARSRFVLDGTGYRDTGLYRPVGLSGYRLRLTGNESGQGGSVAVWESRRKTKNGPRRVLAEAPLFEVEKKLLGLSPHVEHVVMRPQQAEDAMIEQQQQPGRRPRRSKRRTMTSFPPTANENGHGRGHGSRTMSRTSI